MADKNEMIAEKFSAYCKELEDDLSLSDMKKAIADIFNDIHSKKKSKKSSSSDDSSSDEEKKTKKSKSKKTNANVDAKSKKTPSAYNNYMKAKFSEFKEENPDKNAKEIMSLIGASWKTLSDEEKEGYKNSE